MNLEENWKVIKPQNDPIQILDFFEHLLILSKKNSQAINRTLTKEIIEHLSHTTVTYSKSSQKTSIDTTCKSIEALLSSYPISFEHALFCLQIGKFLKKQSKFPESEKFFQKGLETCQKFCPLEPIHAVLLLSLCKLLNKQKRHTEALRVAKQSSHICQDIVVTKNDLSTSELAELTCKAYYQVSIQEDLLGKPEKSLLWKQKAERILHQNAGNYAKLAEKLSGPKNIRRPNEVKSRPQTSTTARNYSNNLEISRKRIAVGKPEKPTAPSPIPSYTQNTLIKERIMKAQKLMRSSKRNNEEVKDLTKAEAKMSRSNSDRKKIKAENFVKVEEEPVPEDVQKLGPSISKDYLYGDYVIAKKVTKCNTFSQTDEKTFSHIGTSTDGLNEIESTIKNVPKTKGKVLVKYSKIDIKQEEFEILYYLNQSFDKILMIVSNQLGSYNKEIEISTEVPVLDYISNQIHPCVDIEKEDIILKSENISTLFESVIYKKEESLSIKIQKTDPRGEIVVSIGQGKLYSKKSFRISEIYPKIHNSLKTPELLALCFDYYDEDIRMRLPTRHVPELLYYKSFKINPHPLFYLKISRIYYEGYSKFLFQPISSSGFSSMIIDEMVLSASCSVPIEFLESHIEKISTLLSIKNNSLNIEIGKIELDDTTPQVESNKIEKIDEAKQENEKETTEIAVKMQSLYRGYLLRKNIEKDLFFYVKAQVSGRELNLEFTDSTLNRKLTLIASDLNKKFYLVIRYPAPFKQPFKTSIPPLLRYRNKELFLRLPSGDNAFLFRSTQQLADNFASQEEYFGIDDEELTLGEIPEKMYNKIIYRTCLKRNNIMHQISMVLVHSNTNEDILHFFIRHGPTAENNQKCVIDLNTVCLKSKLSKHNLELIGNYVVENMINFAGSDVSFLNIEDKNNKRISSSIKIQAFFRGLIARKRIQKKSFKTILKRHVNSLGKKWLCLFKSSGNDLVVQAVNSNHVVQTRLNLAKISNENQYPSLKDFFRNKIISQIKIEENEESKYKYSISGIQEYEAPSGQIKD